MFRFTIIIGFLIIIFPYAYFSVPFSPTSSFSARQVTGECNTTFTKSPYSNPNTITTSDGNIHSLPCMKSPVICYMSDDVKYTITQYVTNGECVNNTSSIWFYVIAQCGGYIWGGTTSYEIQKC
jgi:hypothetical protein